MFRKLDLEVGIASKIIIVMSKSVSNFKELRAVTKLYIKAIEYAYLKLTAIVTFIFKIKKNIIGDYD